jgi:hypothetical protein
LNLQGFFDWYNRKLTGSLVITAVILYLQLPHMVWAADAYLRLGIITRVHPAIDFLLYGVDLIELLAIANVTLMIAARLNKK